MIKFTKTLALTATATAALVASLSIPAVAYAEDAPTKSSVISVPDLTTAAGLDQAKSEIHRAASHICGLDIYDSIGARAKARKCYAEAVAKASARLDVLLALQTSQKAPQQALAGKTTVPTR